MNTVLRNAFLFGLYQINQKPVLTSFCLDIIIWPLLFLHSYASNFVLLKGQIEPHDDSWLVKLNLFTTFAITYLSSSTNRIETKLNPSQVESTQFNSALVSFPVVKVQQ